MKIFNFVLIMTPAMDSERIRRKDIRGFIPHQDKVQKTFNKKFNTRAVGVAEK